MTITLYAKPEGTCPPCTATEKALIRDKIAFTKIDVTENQEGLDRILELGHRAAPVVVVEETGENWSGYDPGKIKALSSQ